MFTRENVKDIYPLSPLQEGILFHYLMDRKSGAYFEQAFMNIQGEIDLDLWEKSFNRLVERYDILRTIFNYKRVKVPQQVVLKRRETKINFEDRSYLSQDDKALFFKDFRKLDRLRGFNLERDIPMRISIIRISDQSHYIIWSFHHIIMDGWCLGILIKDLLYIYKQLKKGQAINLPAEIPYSTYIKWLGTQDKEKGLKYWEEYLRGYDRQATLSAFENSSDGFQNKYQQDYYSLILDQELSDRLTGVARKNQVTVNTVFQTIWGLMLQRYNNTTDVVYGATVSGRPSEIKGVEDIIGLFINAVPVRIRVEGGESFARLLQKVQQNEVASKSYEYLPLAEIQSRSHLKKDLIDHLLIFENYPVEEGAKSAGRENILGFELKNLRMTEQTNYDFNIEVGPGKCYIIKFNYNSLKFNPDAVEKISRQFREVIDQIVENDNMDTRDIRIPIDLLTAEVGNPHINFNFEARGDNA